MPIQVNDINVIDDNRNIITSGIATIGSGSSATVINGTTGVVNVGTGITIEGISGNISIAGTITAGGINFPLQFLAVIPTNGATGVNANTDISLIFNGPPTIGIGTIELREDSTSGTIIESFNVSTSSSITVSNTSLVLNPTSDLPFETQIFLVIPSTAIENFVGLNTTGADSYSFTSGQPLLGSSYEGGFLICASGGTRWVVAPNTSEVSRNWHSRNDANTTAQQVSGCSGWFIPSCGQLQNPGFSCRTYWDSYSSGLYWSNTEFDGNTAWAVNMSTGCAINDFSSGGSKCFAVNCVRAFRCVTY
jgi:hypothetical protein